jgi:hypothetical protein
MENKEFDFRTFTGNYKIVEVERDADDMVDFVYPESVVTASDAKSVNGYIHQLRDRFRFGSLDVLYWNKQKERYYYYSHVIP